MPVEIEIYIAKNQALDTTRSARSLRSLAIMYQVTYAEAARVGTDRHTHTHKTTTVTLVHARQGLKMSASKNCTDSLAH